MSTLPNSVAGAALAALVPLAVLLIAAAKCGARRRALRGATHWQRALALAAFAVVASYGGDKGGPAVPPRAVQLLTVLRDGTLKDRSGRVASGAAEAAVAAFGEQTAALAAAAAEVAGRAQADCDALVARMATNDYSVAYVRMELPRGTSVVSNHNIMVTCERTERTASDTVDRLVWFSAPPTTNVVVHARYRTSGGHVGTLAPSTNFWPATETVGGVECVRYRYELPADVRAYALVPSYEVAFGGPEPGQYVSVPESGVTVRVGAAEHLPFTGWDDYGDGVRVRSVGGVAVAIEIAGTTYEGVNPL